MGMEDFDTRLFDAIDRRVAREATIERLRGALVRSAVGATGMAVAVVAMLG